MNIFIDGYEANTENRVGIGRYSYELLCGMYRLMQKRMNNTDIRVTVCVPSSPRDDLPKETDWWKYVVLHPQKLWTFFALPIYVGLHATKKDICFSPTHYVPRFVPIKRVFSIMDLSYLEYPDLFLPKDLHQLTHWTKYSATVANAVLTISKYSADAIIKQYAIDKDHVFVTYPGMSTLATSGYGNVDLCKKYGIAKHFILAVGTIQPRKNYIRLIEAFKLFLESNRQKFGKIELVIIGKKGWMYDDILNAPLKMGIDKSVKFLDFIPDSELPVFYKNALCFALPSLYEGFGLPPLEAMTYGTPVVVSNVSSLPEIVGKAGILVDPLNVQDIARGLLRAVRERNLIQGKNRNIEAKKQVQKFSWDKAAEQTLEILVKVGKGEL